MNLLVDDYYLSNITLSLICDWLFNIFLPLVIFSMGKCVGGDLCTSLYHGPYYDILLNIAWINLAPHRRNAAVYMAVFVY